MYESERILRVSHKSGAQTLWCELCARSVSMLTVDEAALVLGTTSRMIFKMAEAGTLHFAETAGGRLYICPNSLG